MAGKFYIAVDLGAESGRVMLGQVTEEKLSLEEIHRFSNTPLEQDGSLRWDFEHLMTEIRKGLGKAVKQQKQITSIAVDTWGVDFGLLGDNGQLLENPYHYRDSRTDGMLDEAFSILPKEKIYENTGTQFMQINSLYQLLAYRKQNSQLFAKAKKLLFMPDLVAYYLTGKIQAEYTIASTSQLMDMKTGKWSQPILQAFDISPELLPSIVKPGRASGKLKKELARQIGCKPVPVVTVGCHDTASAVAGVPASSDRRWAFLSSGTWSLMGMEYPHAIVNSKSFEHQFTNEGGVQDTIRVLKNVTGLWLVQQCRSCWAEQGTELSYSQLTEMARSAEPFKAKLDVDYEPFLSPGDMPEKINTYLSSTGQKTIDNEGQMVRVMVEGLAARYAEVIKMLEELSEEKIELIHLVGGGIKNTLLNQLTADATGKKVITGPAEATATGNILMQSMASGQISSISQGRRLVAESFDLNCYQPRDRQSWKRY